MVLFHKGSEDTKMIDIKWQEGLYLLAMNVCIECANIATHKNS